MKTNRKFPTAQKHGSIREVFDDIFMVTGCFAVRRVLSLRFSRNMTIVREKGDLTLINSVRLDERGLQALDALGTVKHVIRLAGFHGADDPFYKDRYDATVWAVDAPYVTGLNLNPKPEEIYFSADEILSETTSLPLQDSSLLYFSTAKVGEALVYLARDGGIVISGDCLQNWGAADEYCNIVARILMKRMGFFRAYNVGPGWLRIADPDRNELKRILDLDFEHVLPAHGRPVVNNAKNLYAKSIHHVINRGQ